MSDESKKNWLPTKIPRDGGALALLSCGGLSCRLFILLCVLGATRKDGWRGSMRQLRQAAEGLNWCLDHRDAKRALSALSRAQILHCARRGAWTTYSIKQSGWVVISPVVKTHQSRCENTPKCGENTPGAVGKHTGLEGKHTGGGVKTHPSSEEHLLPSVEGKGEDADRIEATSAQDGPFEGGHLAGSLEGESVDGEVVGALTPGAAALQRASEQAPGLAEKLEALRRRQVALVAQEAAQAQDGCPGEQDSAAVADALSDVMTQIAETTDAAAVDAAESAKARLLAQEETARQRVAALEEEDEG